MENKPENTRKIEDSNRKNLEAEKREKIKNVISNLMQRGEIDREYLENILLDILKCNLNLKEEQQEEINNLKVQIQNFENDVLYAKFSEELDKLYKNLYGIFASNLELYDKFVDGVLYPFRANHNGETKEFVGYLVYHIFIGSTFSEAEINHLDDVNDSLIKRVIEFISDIRNQSE